MCLRMTHNRGRNNNKLDTIVLPSRAPLRSYGGMQGMRLVTTLTRVQQHTALRPLSCYQIGVRVVRNGNIGVGSYQHLHCVQHSNQEQNKSLVKCDLHEWPLY